jgi:hypothetical protein
MLKRFRYFTETGIGGVSRHPPERWRADHQLLQQHGLTMLT